MSKDKFCGERDFVFIVFFFFLLLFNICSRIPGFLERLRDLVRRSRKGRCLMLPSGIYQL